MNSTRFLQLGWVLVAAILGVIVAGDFQAPPQIKIGTVDIVRIMNDSDYGKEGQAIFKKMKDARQGVLEFIETYRVLTTDQAQRIRDLSLKDNATKEESAELDRTKADVIAASKRSIELATKPNMTPDERTIVEEYARRSQNMNDVAKRWLSEFSDQMNRFADDRRLTGLQKAKAAINQVSKSQGFTVVFDTSTAPYGASDITDASLAAMNATK